MLKKYGVQFLGIGLILLVTGSFAMAQSRIRFRRGATEATISGTLPPRGTRFYVAGASAGQYAIVSVVPYNLVVLTPGAPNGEVGNSSFTTRRGDNDFGIYNPTNRTVSYRMTVTIR